MFISGVRRPFAAAVAWSLTAELARHHGATFTFQPIELHPGGGQADLLRLFIVSDPSGSAYDTGAKPLLEFNLIGTARRLIGPGQDELHPWLKRWLEHDDPKKALDDLTAFLHFPQVKPLPPTNRRIFGLRLVAGLLGRTALRRDALNARMGVHDTSGYGGGVDPALPTFTAAWAAGAAARPSSWWLLRRRPGGKAVGVVDLDGRLSGAGAPEVLHDLFPTYLQKKRMEPVLRLAYDMLNK